MKQKFTILFILLVLFVVKADAQFDQTSINFNLGLTVPTADLKGDSPFNYKSKWVGYWLNYSVTPPFVDSTVLYNVLMTDTNFIKENYGASTGFTISGSIKTNLDKWNTFRGLFNISYSNFNTFVTDKTGNAPFLVNNQGFSIIPVAYSSSFNALGLGLGFEVAPTSFTKVLSPYFGGLFNFNLLSATLTRAYGRDSIKAEFGTEFRIGAALYGGMEIKVSPAFDIVAGVRYDFGNLLLKTTRSSYSDALQYGKTNLSLNDAEGFYYSNLASAEGEGVKQYNTKNKNLNWWSFYVGVNLYISELSKQNRKK